MQHGGKWRVCLLSASTAAAPGREPSKSTRYRPKQGLAHLHPSSLCFWGRLRVLSVLADSGGKLSNPWTLLSAGEVPWMRICVPCWGHRLDWDQFKFACDHRDLLVSMFLPWWEPPALLAALFCCTRLSRNCCAVKWLWISLHYVNLKLFRLHQLTENDLIPFQLSSKLPGQWDWMLDTVRSPITPDCSGTQGCWTGWFFHLISPRGAH